jgi:hypothetical protein
MGYRDPPGQKIFLASIPSQSVLAQTALSFPSIRQGNTASNFHKENAIRKIAGNAPTPVAAFERALELDRNVALAHAALGQTTGFIGAMLQVRRARCLRQGMTRDSHRLTHQSDGVACFRELSVWDLLKQ